MRNAEVSRFSHFRRTPSALEGTWSSVLQRFRRRPGQPFSSAGGAFGQRRRTGSGKTAAFPAAATARWPRDKLRPARADPADGPAMSWPSRPQQCRASPKLPPSRACLIIGGENWQQWGARLRKAKPDHRYPRGRLLECSAGNLPLQGHRCAGADEAELHVLDWLGFADIAGPGCRLPGLPDPCCSPFARPTAASWWIEQR